MLNCKYAQLSDFTEDLHVVCFGFFIVLARINLCVCARARIVAIVLIL